MSEEPQLLAGLVSMVVAGNEKLTDLHFHTYPDKVFPVTPKDGADIEVGDLIVLRRRPGGCLCGSAYCPQGDSWEVVRDE